MTQPDIITAEIFGSYPPQDAEERLGECIYCEQPVYDDGEAVQSTDGLFCNMDCCCEYYEITNINR